MIVEVRSANHPQPTKSRRNCFFEILPILVCAYLTGGCQPSERKNAASPDPDNPQPAKFTKETPSINRTSYQVAEIAHHSGCCDGSAGVALDDRYFLVANDENSVLRIYSRHQSSNPISEIDVRKFLDLKKKDDESDLEGMTRIGNQVYVIASHARSKDGDKRKGRRQLFALTYTKRNGAPSLSPFGEPYTDLLKNLEKTKLVEGLDFDAAGKRSGDERDGLNIEGLTSTPDRGLLIGFRYPVHLGSTILIKIQNPEQVMQGGKPIFSGASQLMLGGMGIRGLERYGSTYLLSTESSQGKRYPQLFAWDGVSRRPKRLFTTLPRDLNPESILIFPDSGLSELHILSDDGNKKWGADPCNEIDDKDQRRFRRVILRSTQ